MESLAKWIPSLQPYIGGEFKQKLLFVPDADNKPEEDHEISEPALFRFLLNEENLKQLDEVETTQMLGILKDIDKNSKIAEFETHQSSMDMLKDFKNAFHVFIVFKSTSVTDGVYWWSLEKGIDYITLQRSRNKENVKNKFDGDPRNKVKPIVENLKGKGTIKDLFAILWAQQMIPEKYHILNSNCQSFVTFISQQITQEEYEYKGYFKCPSPPENGRNQKMLDLIVILRGSSDWPPLFDLISIENVDLVDKMMESGKYDINAFYNGLSPLHFAITFSKTQMVQHLLKHPLNAEPTTRGASGKSALQLAVTSTMKAEIIDLLLAHDKVHVDDVDEEGETALHWAAYVSNDIAVRKLIKKGANPHIFDKNGWSPLHVAARQRDGDAIIDLLVAHSKVKVDDVDNEGETALHFAASVSNVIAVKKLIENGAHPNIIDKKGMSPLHVAAQERDGNPIIDLLLEAKKVKGLGDVNDRNEQGETALHFAAISCNETTAEHLIRKGADPNCRNNIGDTPLHRATFSAMNMNIIDLLLLNIKEGDIEKYRNDEALSLLARHNVHGLGKEIADRFFIKGISKLPSTETDEVTEESEEETGVTRRFLEKDADTNLINKMMRFGGLLILVDKNSQELDKILTEKQIDINGRDENGDTPLIFVIRANNVNGVRLLLEKGADPTTRDNKGYTPFHVATQNYKDSDILNLLLANEKVDINETTFQEGWTALHFATASSNVTSARFLLSNGANPNVADENGVTPLHCAVMFAKDMDIVELLLNHKDVDVNCLTNDGYSALDYANNKRGQSIVNRLKEKGAVEREKELPKINNDYLKKHMRVYSNRKPDEIENFLSDETKTIEDKIAKISEEYLVSAIFKDSNVESVRLIFKNGADISAWEEMGVNALHLASCYANATDVIDAILETGKFDINRGDNEGLTSLHYAMGGTNLETNARHLIGKGADTNIANNRGNTPLHFAAFYAKTIETINLILENKQVDINRCDKLGGTALHYAIEKKNVEMVRYLLEKGADPTIRNNEGDTPFHLAALFLTDSAVLGLMLRNEKKIEIDGRNKKGSTALQLTMVWSNMTAAHFLLSKRANPNVADENGRTPLHLAAGFAKDMDIVELLLNHKDVDVNCLDNKGRNALDYGKRNIHGHGERITKLLKEKGVVSQTVNSLDDEKAEIEATFENYVKAVLEKAFVADSEVGMIRFLIEQGADISTLTWGEGGWNALHTASIVAKTTEILDVILGTEKFDINSRKVSNGETALHFALHAKNMTTASYLLKKGADPTVSDKNGVTPLHMAANRAATTDIIKLMTLKYDVVDINSRDNKGMTPLHYAIEASNVITARYLMKIGADPTIGDSKGNTSIHMAAALSQESDILDLILADINDKFDIDHRNQSGWTALHFATATSNVTSARFLLSNGANPNAADEDGKTPLHWAALSANDMNMVKLLINHKDMNVNYLDNEGYNALQYAKHNQHGLGERIDFLLKTGLYGTAILKCTSDAIDENLLKELVENAIVHTDAENVRILIEMGADIGKVKWGAGTNALHAASKYAKKTEILDVILTTGEFYIDDRDDDGETALHFALRAKNVTTARHLLEKGADPTIPNNAGITPFHTAAAHVHEPDNILDLFVANKKEIDIDHQNQFGMTALHIAITESNIAAAGFLLSKGANPNAADRNGKTPLHFAAYFASVMDMAKLLLNHKATNVNYLDNAGRNALHYAMINEHGLSERIANLLREKMAAKAEGDNYEPKNIAALVPGRIKEDSDIKTIRFLIENEQDVSAMTWGENGANALHLAAANEKTTDLIDVILETGKFDINGVDSDQRTPLHYAIKRPNPVTINARRLIKMGANPGIADKNGVTPLHMAARNAESMDLIELLLNTEAVDVNCVDKQGRTPLDCAGGNKHGLGQRIIARLREYDEKEW